MDNSSKEQEQSTEDNRKYFKEMIFSPSKVRSLLILTEAMRQDIITSSQEDSSKLSFLLSVCNEVEENLLFARKKIKFSLITYQTLTQLFSAQKNFIEKWIKGQYRQL